MTSYVTMSVRMLSWSWFYPHHFSPWITDIKNFADMEMKFELSAPFLPFEQLMAVLPAASKSLVPPALQVDKYLEA